MTDPTPDQRPVMVKFNSIRTFVTVPATPEGKVADRCSTIGVAADGLIISVVIVADDGTALVAALDEQRLQAFAEMLDHAHDQRIALLARAAGAADLPIVLH